MANNECKTCRHAKQDNMVVNGNCIAIFQGALGASGEQYGIDAKGEHIPHGGGVAGPLQARCRPVEVGRCDD